MQYVVGRRHTIYPILSAAVLHKAELVLIAAAEDIELMRQRGVYNSFYAGAWNDFKLQNEYSDTNVALHVFS